ncbi:hypothetical protein V5N11_000937 [Cardamine amara subsp. amara]|uniref:DC1 domain-containing protein n=1 Tax=Cardamine amara subsp. amara TaxID=228776 RepID=A0ABD1AS42_CARAN
MDPLPNAASCRLLCPQERFVKDIYRKVITVSGKIFHVVSSPYWIPDAVHENSHHLQFVEEGGKSCYSCSRKILEKAYYYCSHCCEDYHKECVESPSLFQSSSQPKHPLQLVWFPGYYNT